MLRFTFLLLFLLVFLTGNNLFSRDQYVSQGSPDIIYQDTLLDNQTLYNGRIWKNLYFLVQDNQFLFSKEFLPGKLTISGKNFNVLLKYDIFKDEVLTPLDSGRILQLNKELIDSFSLSFQSKLYKFIKMKEDSLKTTKSFFNVLYNGKTTLLLKSSKKIDKLSVEGKYDKFYQINSIYIVTDNKLYPVAGKGDLFKILQDDKIRMKEYIKSNKLRISERQPESFIPVIRFHDRIQ